MELGDDFMDDFKNFMRYRQEYLKTKHSGVVAATNEAQPTTPSATNVPSVQPEPPSGFQVLPLPQDLQLNLVKCVKDEGMKVMTPETVFIQQVLREVTKLKAEVNGLTQLLTSIFQVQQSSRSSLLPVAQQDDNAFRPIEVKEPEDTVPSSSRRVKKKRDARNRRSTPDSES